MKHFGKVPGDRFRKVVQARSQLEYDVRLRALKAEEAKQGDTVSSAQRQDIHDYYESIEAKRFAMLYAPLEEYPRFGQVTSNLSKSLNGTCMDERASTVFECYRKLWSKCAGQNFERHRDRSTHPRWSRWCVQYLQD